MLCVFIVASVSFQYGSENAFFVLKTFDNGLAGLPCQDIDRSMQARRSKRGKDLQLTGRFR